MTIRFTLPVMTDPFFVIELETITGINCGIVAGGFELPPGLVVHVLPHAGRGELFSKPLKALGADPPVIGFLCDH